VIIEHNDEITIDYDKLKFSCANCNKNGCDLVVDGYVYTDLDDNGLCVSCYESLKKLGSSRRFLSKWIGVSRPLTMNIYD